MRNFSKFEYFLTKICRPTFWSPFLIELTHFSGFLSSLRPQNDAARRVRSSGRRNFEIIFGEKSKMSEIARNGFQLDETGRRKIRQKPDFDGHAADAAAARLEKDDDAQQRDGVRFGRDGVAVPFQRHRIKRIQTRIHAAKQTLQKPERLAPTWKKEVNQNEKEGLKI